MCSLEGSCCHTIIAKGRAGTARPAQAPIGARSVRAARSSAARRAALIRPGKGQLSVARADADAIARDELALQDLLSERILDLLLDGALERSCTIDGVEARLA